MPDALPDPLPTVRRDSAAARLREQAFQHLRQAIELGYADTAHLSSDPDLVPLHDDAR